MCDDAGLDFMNTCPENIAMPAGDITSGQVESWYGVCISFKLINLKLLYLPCITQQWQAAY
jgi:hypothetical protein